MIWFKNIFSDPNKADSDKHHWRRQFKRILVSKNAGFHNLTEEQIFQMERKLENEGISLKQACEDEEGVLDFDRLYRDSQKEAQFRKIVFKALCEAGIKTDEERSAFVEYAIGADYQELPYQFWPYRLQKNLHMIVDPSSSVYQALRQAADNWKQNRIIVTSGGFLGN